jgi:hypothetical protein
MNNTNHTSSVFSNQADVPGILNGLRLMCEPGAVHELRSPKAGKDGTISGYFNDLAKMAEAAKALSHSVPGVYLTLNPVKTALLGRANNRIERRAALTTTDKDIVRRRLLLIDADADRPAGISSTDAEHEAALAKAREIRDHLTGLGFPLPLLADSGNGGHLVYGLDLPNDAEATKLLSDFLRALALRFSTGQVKIDEKVFNAARISKVYNTMVRKGDNLPDRPHRLSLILEAPDCLTPIPREFLEQVARQAESARQAETGKPSGTTDREALKAERDRLSGASESVAWVEGFLERHGIGVKAEKPDSGRWRARCVLERCPFCDSEDGSAVVTVNETGAIGFKCQHNRCADKHWRDFRRHFEPDHEGPGGEPGEEAQGRKPSKLNRLIDLTRSACRVVRDEASEEALARVPGVGWCPVKSTAFRDWLIEAFKAETGETVRAGDVADAVFNIPAAARERVRAYHRVARLDGCIFVDLCRGDGQAVRIAADGWWVVDNPPVVFLHKKDMASLPVPQLGGAVEEWQDFVNLSDEDSPLFLGWLLDSMKGHSPYSILAVNGEQGGGKTCAARYAGEATDPALVAKTKRLPRTPEELDVLGSNRHVLIFDNIGWISPDISDALCRRSTGSGSAKRALYTDNEEHVFGGSNPVLLNGIPEIGDASDLLGRMVKITLRPIPDDRRAAEKALDARFFARLPYLLGALYSLVANGLKHEASVMPEGPPRMADTHRWLLACEQGRGLRLAETFAGNLRENVKGFALETLFGTTLKMFLQEQAGAGYVWRGTASQLHDALRPYWAQACGANPKDMNRYPGNGRAVSSELNKHGASLRANGIVSEQKREGQERSRIITLDGTGYFQKHRLTGEPTDQAERADEDRAFLWALPVGYAWRRRLDHHRERLGWPAEKFEPVWERLREKPDTGLKWEKGLDPDTPYLLWRAEARPCCWATSNPDE